MDLANKNNLDLVRTEGTYIDGARKNYLGISCDDISIKDTLRLIDNYGTTRFLSIVTPNIDHIVKLNSKSHAELNFSYSRATLILNDSKVVKLLSNILRLGIVNVATGSDLVEKLISRDQKQHFLLIGPNDSATQILRGKYPSCTFENVCPDRDKIDKAQSLEIVELAAQPRFTIILFCMGCPMSENLLSQIADHRTFGVGISCGAAIDFLTGKQRRAPKFIRAMSMEWLFRAFSQPSRLGKRYACNLIQLPMLLAKLAASRSLYSNRSW